SFFFFSSRRRHTRFSRDWSSDVCSSDLRVCKSCSPPSPRAINRAVQKRHTKRLQPLTVGIHVVHTNCEEKSGAVFGSANRCRFEIGRASCRERGTNTGAAEAEKEKTIEG